MKKIEVILKVTEKCNLRCKYCYNNENSRKDECLSLERFEKLLRVLLTGYNLIHIIWHGGEPMSAGIDYFRAAMDVEKRVHIETGVVIENSIQTNGTLIDSTWIKFFKTHGFRVGLSFDGVNNEKYRQGTDKVMKAIKLLNSEGMKFGCNAVVADDEYDLLANYEFFKGLGISFDFSRIISEGGAKDMPSLESVSYAEKMCRLFDLWVKDTDGVSIRSFALYLNLAAGGNFRICSCASCHMKYLSITADGSVYNCARESMRSYPFGNIDDFEKADEIFNSDGARALVLGSVKRRNKCKESCEYFDLCAGGCADIAMVENGLENMPTEYCYVFKTVYSHVKEFYEGVMRDNTPLSELNPTVKNVFARGLSKMSMTAQNPLGDSYV